jgi:NDP-sugar pyrophosphorylase family protein
MKAVIPCAKKKDQMFPFSETKPTALVPVAGKPIVRHLIDSLKGIGVEEFCIVVNHLEDKFRDEFTEPEIEIVRQEELDGTAGAIEACGELDEDFFVVNGDVIVSEEDLRALKKKFENTGSEASLLAAGEDRPEKFGVLSITNDEVDALEEKPEDPDNSLVNTGIYIFRPEIMDIIEDLEGKEKSLTDAVKNLLDAGEVTFELVSDYWIDAGEPGKLLKGDRVKREFGIEGQKVSDTAEVHEKAEILGDARIEDDAVIKPGAVIEDDVFIGRGCEIEPNTHIKNSTVSRGSVVNADRIEDSLVFENCIIDSGVAVENSILGEEVDMRSGTVMRESFIGARSYIEMNNSIRGVKFVPDARTDLSEISK